MPEKFFLGLCFSAKKSRSFMEASKQNFKNIFEKENGYEKA